MHERHGAPFAVLLAVPLIAALVLTLFAWPAARLGPRDLPIGVAGPPQAVAPLEQRLAQEDGAFDVHRYPDAAAASRAIREREVYGAFVAGPSGLLVLAASAASPAVAQLLAQAAAGNRPVSGGGAAAVRVQDLVPLTEDDPRGGALAASVLPLVIAGIVAALISALVGPPGARQVAALVLAAILSGLAAVAIAQGWLGALRGPWLDNAAALGLLVLAVGAVVAGLRALFGTAGIGVGAGPMALIGNPWSGMSSAPELLPEPAGDVGRLLPPGAGGQLLRSTAFFDGNGAGEHLVVLAVWTLIGLALLAVAAARRRPVRDELDVLAP